jgi:hypothetical protein
MDARLGRNDPCHCGSGKKYKRCCLDQDAAARSAEFQAERELLSPGELAADDWRPDDDAFDNEWEPAPPFERGEVQLVTYTRGFAETGEQIGSGEGFQVTQWTAPDIPHEILDAFELESVWQLDGWWGDTDAAQPIQFDLISINTLHDDPLIEVQNRAAVFASGQDVEALARITRVCKALEAAAARGTGRSWISEEDEDDEDDPFAESGTGYDPEVAPDPTSWLALDEMERIDGIRRWHQRHHVPLPSPRLHAALHTVVENQLALGEQAVIDTLARLRDEGLTRHDAIHAICTALSEQLWELGNATADGMPDPDAAYRERLQHLTAAGWLRLADDN